MPSDCPYCGKPHFNFGDDEEGVEMWINEPNDGEYVIVADPPYAWSIPALDKVLSWRSSFRGYANGV